MRPIRLAIFPRIAPLPSAAYPALALPHRIPSRPSEHETITLTRSRRLRCRAGSVGKALTGSGVGRREVGHFRNPKRRPRGTHLLHTALQSHGEYACSGDVFHLHVRQLSNLPSGRRRALTSTASRGGKRPAGIAKFIRGLPPDEANDKFVGSSPVAECDSEPDPPSILNGMFRTCSTNRSFETGLR
jgi:hypothetical protein